MSLFPLETIALVEIDQNAHDLLQDMLDKMLMETTDNYEYLKKCSRFIFDALAEFEYIVALRQTAIGRVAKTLYVSRMEN
jgi:hypothetical protein